MPLRKSVVIAPADLTRIFDALERRAGSGDFFALRTRAFVYLLADGVLKTKAAIWLNAEEVVQDPSAKRIRVVQEAVQRPSEANQYRKRKILMTDRTRDAIAEYLEVARNEGWFPHGRLKGPLWIATEHRGTLQRLSQRTAMAVWRKFLDEVKVAQDYQLEDIVFTGRVRFLELANGNLDALASTLACRAVRLHSTGNTCSSRLRAPLAKCSRSSTNDRAEARASRFGPEYGSIERRSGDRFASSARPNRRGGRVGRVSRASCVDSHRERLDSG